MKLNLITPFYQISLMLSNVHNANHRINTGYLSTLLDFVSPLWDACDECLRPLQSWLVFSRIGYIEQMQFFFIA